MYQKGGNGVAACCLGRLIIRQNVIANLKSTNRDLAIIGCHGCISAKATGGCNFTCHCTCYSRCSCRDNPRGDCLSYGCGCRFGNTCGSSEGFTSEQRTANPSGCRTYS